MKKGPSGNSFLVSNKKRDLLRRVQRGERKIFQATALGRPLDL
jgi:hypothetical protein